MTAPGREPQRPTPLSICVIGRNEGANLPALIESLQALRSLPFRAETIYVDSASSDNSVAIASRFFRHVYVLRDSEYLCASAGRYIGTLMCQGDWILYLDGDMILAPEFIEFISQACLGTDAEKGWIGKYRYIYANGQIRDNALHHVDTEKAVNHFGGAVLLRRSAVIAAGNWNPCIFSNEEIELYTRLRRLPYAVFFSARSMIEHHTPYYPKWRIFCDNLFPNRRLGKKYYGFGQVIAARLADKTLLSFIRYFPYPFIFWAGVLSGFISLPVGGQHLAGLLVGFATGYVWLTKGISFIALYIAFLPQMMLGFRTHHGSFVPEISRAIVADETK